MNRTILLIALCGATIFPGCHKSHNTSANNNCKLMGIHVAGTNWSGTYVISYDNAGNGDIDHLVILTLILGNRSPPAIRPRTLPIRSMEKAK